MQSNTLGIFLFEIDNEIHAGWIDFEVSGSTSRFLVMHVTIYLRVIATLCIIFAGYNYCVVYKKNDRNNVDIY